MHQLPFDGSLAHINHQYYIQGEPLSWIQITDIKFQIKNINNYVQLRRSSVKTLTRKKIFTDVLVYD